jgi:hypothetical protein
MCKYVMLMECYVLIWKQCYFLPSINKRLLLFLAAWRKPCAAVIREASPWVCKGRTRDLGVQSKECPYVLSRGWGLMFSCMRNVPVILFWIECALYEVHKAMESHLPTPCSAFQKNFQLSNGSEYLCILIHLQIFKIPVFALSLWDIVCRLRKDVFNPF